MWFIGSMGVRVSMLELMLTVAIVMAVLAGLQAPTMWVRGNCLSRLWIMRGGSALL